MRMFAFVLAHQARFPVTIMCQLLEVSTSGFYAWRRRQPSPRAHADAALTRRIRQIHKESRGTYGAPRVHAELRLGHGIRVGRKRVARLMRTAGLVGAHRRSTRPVTTLRDCAARPAPDLVDRHFTATRPNQLWVADITYLPTGMGFLYLAVVLDACSRRVIGWSMQPHLRTDLVVAALWMAVDRRRPPAGTIHHSDQGSQYTSITYGLRLRQAGLVASMGSVGDCYDNAL